MEKNIEIEELISVIIPIHNYQIYFENSVKSILQQTYKNLEIIIISDDTSGLVIKAISLLQDKRLKLINGPKKGIAAALNKAIKYANGKYIARMDADDFALKNKFKSQLNFLLKNNLDVCGTNIKTIGLTDYNIKFPEVDKDIKYYALFGSPMAHPTVLGKATIFKEFLYNESISASEDYELWIRMAKSGIKFGNIQESLLLYRIHTAQGSKTNIEKNNISIIIAHDYASYYFNNDVDEIFIKTGFGFYPSYFYTDVSLLLETILKYAQKSFIPTHIFEKTVISLYSKIIDYSFIVLKGYYKFQRDNCLNINFKFIFYLIFKCFYKNALPYKIITFLKKHYK